MSYRPNHPFVLETKKRLISKYIQDGKILDIGCGEGTLLREIQNDTSLAVGVDPRMEVLRQAHDSQLPVARCLPDRIPFAAHTFDTVYAFGIVPNVDTFQDVIREFTRVVRPGGYVLLEAYNRLSAAYWLDRILGRETDEKPGRHDTLVELKKDQPFELELVEVAGIQMTTPSLKLLNAPGLRLLWQPLERAAARTHLRFFGAALVLILRKREDLEYKER